MLKVSLLKYLSGVLAAFFVLSFGGAGFAADSPPPPPPEGVRDSVTPTFLLMIKEQNIEGPQQAWWTSEVDLSTVEANIAQILNSQGYRIIEPSQLRKFIEVEPAFRTVDVNEADTLELAKLQNIDYVVLGKAVASAGGTILNSKMRSCFANVTVKLIRVRDGKVVAYLDATASSPHIDVITGGKQALAKAGRELGEKIVRALVQEGGVMHGCTE